MKTRKIVTISILTSLAIVLSIVESFIPSIVPGSKLGLANIITLIIIYMYSYKEAFLSLIIRIFIVGLLYSGLFSVAFMLSLSGGLLSFIAMLLIHKITKDIYFTSLMGSLFHSIGQILYLIVIMSTADVLYYLPILILISIPTGIVTSLISVIVLKYFKYEVNKIKLVPFISFIVIGLLSLGITLYFSLYKDNTYTYSSVYYNGEEILKINLDKVEELDENDYNEYIKSFTKDEDSYIYTLNILNSDDNSYHDLIIEVKNKEIRIKESHCEKKICTHSGYISNRFERIICVPNNIIISINENDNDVDFKM